MWIEQDYDFVTVKTRKELLPYMWKARKEGKRAILRGNKLKVGNQLFDLEYCKNNLRKEENEEGNSRRSRSLERQEERGRIQESGRVWRSNSQSPRRRSWMQRELQHAETTQGSNDPAKQAEGSMAGVSQQETSFRVGEPTRAIGTCNTGNFREEALQTVSSECGSITRVKMGHKDVGSYFLRTGTTRRR